MGEQTVPEGQEEQPRAALKASHETGAVAKISKRFGDLVTTTRGALRDRPRKRSAFWLLGFVLLVGLILVDQAKLIFPDRWHDSGKHLGDALIIASILGIIWHMQEFADFFSSLARDVMIEKAFLVEMRGPTLRRLRSQISAVMVGRHVDNPRHLWKSLHAWSEEQVFQRWLPSRQKDAGIYRNAYREHVVLQPMKLSAALRSLGVDATGLSEEILDLVVIKQTGVTSYELVAPRRSQESYTKTYSAVTAVQDIPGRPNRTRLNH